MNYWPTTRERPLIVQREFKGENKLDPFSIGDSYATETKNVTSNKYPALTVRPGYTSLGGSFGSKILGLGVWKDSELQAVMNGMWYKRAGSAWINVASGLNPNADWSFANFKGNLSGISLIAANGVDPIKVYDGTTLSNLATAPAGGNYIEQYMDRLYCAVGNDLRFSSYRKANDWTTAAGDDADSGFITVETPNGETLNAIKSGLTHLTLFKPSSIHELYGSAPSNYRMVTVTTEIGIINNKCAATINGTMYFLDDKGIYQYSGGTLPDKQFSLPVQYYIDNMNKAARNTCCVGTDGKKLYVSIPMVSSTAPDTILEYDPQFGTWYVWKDFTTLQFAKMGDNWFTGDTAGKVLLMGGVADESTAITWEWVSKPFGSDSLARKIRWHALWIVVDLPLYSSLNVYLSKSASGDDWELAKSITSSSTIQGARVIIPTNMVANANYIRIKFTGSGPCTVYSFDRDQRDMPMV